MSVSSNDLKSMLSRVRGAEGLAQPPKPKQPPAPLPPPEEATGSGGAAASAAATAVAEESAETLESESTDIGTILSEIMEDEELMTRILGILYRAKKKTPHGGAVAIIPMERELGIERESATFVLNYMKTKRYIETDDKSRNIITVVGIDFLRARVTLPVVS